MKKRKKQETTNHTNSTNKLERFIIFHGRDIFIVNPFVRFVLFVVKKWSGRVRITQNSAQYVVNNLW